eukprot:CAMPEP_0117442804 /NCGR_PEP_ID=MMETSP0759-20121206/4351_1 /TAXON_ID=63605 /ORGANISM="Percolomonas cosmopolitus, Strain WS" /LENGTH=340 /DNA_ID=CAMNT_0005234725 /DNA_START=83 /DNA_END=1105 /DNA_ORIENTATION=+
MGRTNINWQEIAMGIGKNRRKTIGFGKYSKKERQYEDEFYIRELSIIDGGIGCALWDAAIILTRFIYEHGHQLFQNQNILELGAGVGLPGICAGRFGEQVLLTDYMEPVVDNLTYNTWLNGEAQLDDLDDEQHAQHDDNEVEQKHTQSILSPKQKKMILLQNVKSRCKSFLLDWYQPEHLTNLEHNFDILLGSELTYTGSLETIKHLIRVIDTTIAEGGVFLEILSDDRDGVHAFLDLIVAPEMGYSYSIHKVPDKYMGNFCTNQLPETYKFYLLTKDPNSERFKEFQQCLGPVFTTNVEVPEVVLDIDAKKDLSFLSSLPESEVYKKREEIEWDSSVDK